MIFTSIASPSPEEKAHLNIRNNIQRIMTENSEVMLLM